MTALSLVEVLDLAEKSYALAIDEYGDARKNGIGWKGQLPKRKHPAYRIVDRLRSKHKISICGLDAASLKLIAAAYDKGLYDRHDELNAKYIQGEVQDEHNSCRTV